MTCLLVNGDDQLIKDLTKVLCSRNLTESEAITVQKAVEFIVDRRSNDPVITYHHEPGITYHRPDPWTVG